MVNWLNVVLGMLGCVLLAILIERRVNKWLGEDRWKTLPQHMEEWCRKEWPELYKEGTND